MNRTVLRPLAAILLVCSLTACAPASSNSAQSNSSTSNTSSSQSQAVTFTDDLGRTVTVDHPQRVAASPISGAWPEDNPPWWPLPTTPGLPLTWDWMSRF